MDRSGAGTPAIVPRKMSSSDGSETSRPKTLMPRSTSLTLIAAMSRAAPSAQLAVTRPCLRCRTPIESEGPHHRLCYGCGTESVSPCAL